MVGVGSIGLTILVTYGLCSGFGLFFGPMHNVIPFLFLGIGNLLLSLKFLNSILLNKIALLLFDLFPYLISFSKFNWRLSFWAYYV